MDDFDLDAVVASVSDELSAAEDDSLAAQSVDETQDESDEQDLSLDSSESDDAGDDETDITAQLAELQARLEATDQRARQAEDAKAEHERKLAAAAAEFERLRFLQEEQEAQAYADQLEETDPDLARTYRDHRGKLHQRLYQSETRIGSMERGLAALDMALTHLAPDTAAQVYDMAMRLAKEPDAESMQRAIFQAQQAKQETNKELETVKAQLAALQKQLRAQRRNPAADRVARGLAPAASTKRPPADEPFDDYFDRLTASPEFQRVFG